MKWRATTVLSPRLTWRMMWTGDRLASPGPVTTRLGASDVPALQALYADGESSGEPPDFFFPSMGGLKIREKQAGDLQVAVDGVEANGSGFVDGVPVLDEDVDPEADDDDINEPVVVAGVHIRETGARTRGEMTL
jgi:hypothetical protein